MSTEKGRDAYRTIGEVAEELELPQHVLRFWETKFGHLRPMKRAGGRRFYRPADVALLKGIRRLLYEDGYTIRGVQRILREQGPRQVAALGRGETEGDASGEPRAAPPVRPARRHAADLEPSGPSAPPPPGEDAFSEPADAGEAPREEAAPPAGERPAAARHGDAPAPRRHPAGGAASAGAARGRDADGPPSDRAGAAGAAGAAEEGAPRRGLPDEAAREALQRVLSEILACKRILDESE